MLTYSDVQINDCSNVQTFKCSNVKFQMSNIKCQMSIRLNFCRSVPPEFLRSFLLLLLSLVVVVVVVVVGGGGSVVVVVVISPLNLFSRGKK